MTTIGHIVQRHHVGLGQIFHMDVVANAGAIPGIVVGTENTHSVTLAGHALTGHLDQVGRFRCRLPQQAFRIGTRNIEVTENHVVETGGCSQIHNHPLAHHFGRAVGVDRSQRQVLGEHRLLRHAIDRSSRRKHHVRYVVFFDRFQEVQGISGVVAVVLQWVGNRLGHHNIGRKMQNRFKPVTGKQILHCRFIGQISNHQFASSYRPAVACGEVIEHHDVVTGLAQLANHMTANIPGSAGNEDFHRRELLLP